MSGHSTVYTSGRHTIAKDPDGNVLSDVLSGGNDQKIINAAIAYGENVQIVGDFTISAPILVTKPIIIDGIGKGSISTDMALPYMVYVDADDVTVQNLTLKSATKTRNIWIKGRKNVKILNNILKTPPGDKDTTTSVGTTQSDRGVWTDNLYCAGNHITGLGIYLHYTRNALIENNVISNTGRYIALECYYHCENNQFLNNTINYPVADDDSIGIEIGHSNTFTGTCHNNLIKGNRITGAYVGIDINIDTVGNVVAGNTVSEFVHVGIQNRGGTASVSYNTITTTQPGTFGIIDRSGKVAAISNNKITAANGIYIYNSTSGTVLGNTCTSSGYGLLLGDTGITTISQNSFTGKTKAIYHGYGSKIAGHTTYSQNTIYGKIAIHDETHQNIFRK